MGRKHESPRWVDAVALSLAAGLLAFGGALLLPGREPAARPEPPVPPAPAALAGGTSETRAAAESKGPPEAKPAAGPLDAAGRRALPPLDTTRSWPSGAAGPPPPFLTASARVLAAPRGTCASLAVVDEGGPRFASAGTCTGAPPFAATESTLYEIGSISKVFTTSLLAVLEAEGRVAEGDTLSRVLPEARLSRGVGAMSLVDLATHTSGMPRMPTNWIAPDRSQPRAPYDRAELFAFLGSFTPSRPPGARFEYSNVGSGVLGVALAAAAESSYEDLLTSRLLGPLGLGETHLLVPDDARARMALGQDGSGVAIFPRRYMPVLAGCCALQSSARDLARFVGAHLGWAPTAIAEALRRTHAVRRPLSRGEHPVLGGEGVALGWFVREGVRWHGGVTGGWATFVAFDPSLGIGVVVLRNRSAEEPVRDAGFALLAELALGVSPSGPADETAAAEGPGTPRTTP